MGDDTQVGVTASLFAPIQAPRIKSIARKDIQSFLSARAAYEHAIEGQPSLKPVSYRSCFEADYLESLVEAEVFGENIGEVSQLTDDIIKSKLKKLSGAVSLCVIRSGII